MATTLGQIEAEAYLAPPPPDNLSATALPLLEVAWQRIEAYTAVRFAERFVEWVVEGPGDWQPPLRPTTIGVVEEWRGGAWEETTLDPSPLGGFILKHCGPYRLSGTAGDDSTPPALVQEAVRRLGEYLASITFEGAGLRSENVEGVWQGENGNPAWRARALQDSGAADLLRGFRK